VPVDSAHDGPPNEVNAIGAPARRALTGAGLTTWDAVAAAADADLLALHGLGPRALRILREVAPEPRG
jgi:predicted flap endonuclease-1-like 5' DNA nuclease